MFEIEWFNSKRIRWESIFNLKDSMLDALQLFLWVKPWNFDRTE